MIPDNFDLGALMAQAQQMQAQFAAAQDQLAEAEVTGTSGGDLVTVVMRGTGDISSLVIKPEACDPEDTETLADLIIAAVRDANQKVINLQGALMPSMPGMGGPNFPGGTEYA